MQMYATVGTNDLERAVAFYDALLPEAGMRTLFDHPKGGRFYRAKGGGLFGVLTPYDRQAACVGNGMMHGFGLESPGAVDAFHAKALSLGAVNEGAPGPRGPEAWGAYFGYFRDLDGNKFAAYHFAARD